jgi:cytochrome c oxidase cbb3-type subunit 4
MKLVIHSLEQIGNVEIFPIISFIIFFTFFLGMGYYVYKSPKKLMDELGKMPLDESEKQIDDADSMLNLTNPN